MIAIIYVDNKIEYQYIILKHTKNKHRLLSLTYQCYYNYITISITITALVLEIQIDDYIIVNH